MTSKAEVVACQNLRAVIGDLEPGAQIHDSGRLWEFLSGLEYVLPIALAEQHPWWQHESLDGILPATVRKTGPREVEVIGLCILMSDQTLAPVYVHICVSSEADEIEWLECRLGEHGDGAGGLQRIPYNASQLSKQLDSVARRAPQISWAYTAKVGPQATS